jgi:hypothetical protein
MPRKANLMISTTDTEVVREMADLGQRYENARRLPKKFIRKAMAPAIRKERMIMHRENWTDSVEEEIGRNVGCKMSVHGSVLIEIPCEEGHVVEWTSPNRIPPAMVAKKLKQAGWRLGQHVRCPEHNRKTVIDAVQGGKSTMTDTMTTQATDKARTAKRLAMMELEDSFNVEKGQFKTGVSDASIAKELGVAEQVVAKLREEFYGPLKTPDGIEDVRKQLAEFTADHKRKMHELDTGFLEKISKLNNRLDALVAKNGWQA